MEKEIIRQISDLESKIRYCQFSRKQMRFERTQCELDTNQMYRNYKTREKDAVKKIELLRSQLSFLRIKELRRKKLDNIIK